MLFLLNKKSVGEVISISVGKTASLESFYVNRGVRKQGIGSLLLSEIEKIATEEGNSSIKRIGMFCDEESILGYIKVVFFFLKRGYSYNIFYLFKLLKK